MSYKAFQIKVNRLMARLEMTARFFNDTYKGKYSAVCEDGTVITGNATCSKVTVRGYNGRVFMADI